MTKYFTDIQVLQ